MHLIFVQLLELFGAMIADDSRSPCFCSGDYLHAAAGDVRHADL